MILWSEAKGLLRSVRAGALATSTPEHTPFASLVTVATAPDGSPILLVSRLAAHTRHLEADPRLSLLLARSRRGRPARPSAPDDPRHRGPRDGSGRRAALRARFLAKHPKAELYADFPDFSFWLVAIERAQLVAVSAARRASTEPALTDIARRGRSLVAAEAESARPSRTRITRIRSRFMRRSSLASRQVTGMRPGSIRKDSTSPAAIGPRGSAFPRRFERPRTCAGPWSSWRARP